MESSFLSPRELKRYGKQIMLPGIGIEGQEKIRRAAVLVVGAGGLGCPVLQYLVAAGTGKIGIAEYDTVDEANLQRQILYGTADLGKLKSIIARERLEQLSLRNEIQVFNLRIDPGNSSSVFSGFDIIVDATDNLDARYTINDACVSLGLPMVHGSIYMHEGSVSVFNFKGGPDYRCFNPEKPGAVFSNPPPSQVGLFGVLPGITGSLMANEVIKIITGSGRVLSGEVLVFNIQTNTFNIFKIKCPNETSSY